MKRIGSYTSSLVTAAMKGGVSVGDLEGPQSFATVPHTCRPWASRNWVQRILEVAIINRRFLEESDPVEGRWKMYFFATWEPFRQHALEFNAQLTDMSFWTWDLVHGNVLKGVF